MQELVCQSRWRFDVHTDHHLEVLSLLGDLDHIHSFALTAHLYLSFILYHLLYYLLCSNLGQLSYYCWHL